MNLSKTEEELMNHLWKLEKALMKELLEQYPEPKPATTTVATLLKRMNDKGFVGYNIVGKSRETGIRQMRCTENCLFGAGFGYLRHTERLQRISGSPKFRNAALVMGFCFNAA